ncbi:hypothetical protein ACTFIZ_006841 [Dictyostelium cf. discoideum]
MSINLNGNEELKNEDLVANMRKDYRMGELKEEGLLESPFKMFDMWLTQEIELKNEGAEPNAFTLATCSIERKPSARVVLLKHFDHQGFVFYTNYNSRKSKELSENPFASMTFLWTQKQVRIEGSVEKVDRLESEKYFKSRPRSSQIGAWVSEFQSSEVTKQYLEEKTIEMENKFKDQDVPLPPFWGGWRIKPYAFEFWQGKSGRIHDRFKYLPTDSNNENWITKRLSP